MITSWIFLALVWVWVRSGASGGQDSRTPPLRPHSPDNTRMVPAPALAINLQYLPSGSCPWYPRWGAVGRLLLGQHVLPYVSLGWTCWARSADIFECLALSWPDRRHCFPLKLSQSRGGGERGRQWERGGEPRIPFMTECGVGQDRAFGTHARTQFGNTALFTY